MNIKDLSIRNFKGLKNLDMNPGKINVITGSNGSGKTSLLSAIKAGITGDVKNPVMLMETEAKVGMTVFGQHIVRTWGPKNSLTMNGKKTTAKSVNMFLEENCGVKTDTMKMMTGGEIIDKIKSGKLGSFLLENGLVPAEINVNDIIKASRLSDEATALVKSVLPPAPEKFGIDQINQAYKELSAKRLAAKHEYASWSGKAKYEGDAPTKGMDTVDREIATLMAGKTMEAAYRRQLQEYELVLKKRQQMFDYLKNMEVKLKTMQAAEPNRAQKEHLDKMLVTLRNAQVSNRRSEAALASNSERLETALKNLESHHCPLSDKLVCTTDKTAVKDELKEQLDKNKKELERLAAENKSIVEKIQVAEAELVKYEAAMSAYQTYRNAFEEYRAKKASIPELPKMPDDPTRGVKDTDAKLAALRAERNKIAAYQVSVEAGKTADKLLKEIAVMTEVIDLLAPKGEAYASIMRTMLAPLEEYCNAKAKLLRPGFEISMMVADTIAVTCINSETAPFVDVAECSSGEQLLIMFLIMDMLNSLSGFGVLLLDDLDKLDSSAFQELINLLQNEEAVKEYDHIFVAAVDHEDTEKVLKTVPETWHLTHLM